AGADGPHAYSEPPGELGLRPGSEGRRFLVADPDPIDTLVAADRVRYRVQRVAHDAPHVCDSVTGEGVNDRFGNGGHGCLPSGGCRSSVTDSARPGEGVDGAARSEEHTSELQSRFDLVCRLLLEKKKISI